MKPVKQSSRKFIFGCLNADKESVPPLLPPALVQGEDRCEPCHLEQNLRIQNRGFRTDPDLCILVGSGSSSAPSCARLGTGSLCTRVAYQGILVGSGYLRRTRIILYSLLR